MMSEVTPADDPSSASWLLGQADLVRPMVLRVAATLHLADHLEEAALSAAELAIAAGAEPGPLQQLLRYLSSIGVVGVIGVEHDDNEECDARYRLLEPGRPLLDGHPSGLRARLDITEALGRADLALASLLHSVKTGGPGYVDHYGQPFWVDLATNPQRHAHYDLLMGADATKWSAALLPAYHWDRLRTVVDVGGGDATLLIKLLGAVPAMTGKVFEQPTTAETARANLAAAGLEDRAEAIGGSFFDSLPPGADGYLLVAVLHNWDDAAAASILQRCREAAGVDGCVLVVEKTGEGGEAPSPDMDIRGLVYFGGRERGVADIAKLAASIGLSSATVHAAGELSIVELRPS